MAGTLTKKAKVTAEKARISQLTDTHDQHFKIILSHQINRRHNFNSINAKDGTTLSPTSVLKMYRAFGQFMDRCLKLSITEVENKYRRQTDVHEGTYDPESDDEVQVEHYCLFEDGIDGPNPHRDSIRIHGYARTKGGYFVITKLDWHHQVHR